MIRPSIKLIELEPAPYDNLESLGFDLDCQFYAITGNVTLAADWDFHGITGTDGYGKMFFVLWEATVVLNTHHITLFGHELTATEAANKGIFIVGSDGAGVYTIYRYLSAGIHNPESITNVELLMSSLIDTAEALLLAGGKIALNYDTAWFDVPGGVLSLKPASITNTELDDKAVDMEVAGDALRWESFNVLLSIESGYRGASYKHLIPHNCIIHKMNARVVKAINGTNSLDFVLKVNGGVVDTYSIAASTPQNNDDVFSASLPAIADAVAAPYGIVFNEIEFDTSASLTDGGVIILSVVYERTN